MAQARSVARRGSKGTDYAALLTITPRVSVSRRGEALGLRWEGFDADGLPALKVTHSVKRVRDHSWRSVAVRGWWWARLKTAAFPANAVSDTSSWSSCCDVQRVRLAEQRIGVGAAWQDFGLIFPSGVGTPRDPDNLSHTFSRITRRAGLGHWHVHELRHSGASLMLAQGTDLYVVSEVLGHSSVAITKDVYGHLVEGPEEVSGSADVRRAPAGRVWLPEWLLAGASRAGDCRLHVWNRLPTRRFNWRTRRGSNSQPSDP